MKLVECPSCGCKFQIDDRRRPRVDLNCPIILDNLNETRSVAATAKELKIGRATIYRLLKQRGVNPKDITGRKYNKKEKSN